MNRTLLKGIAGIIASGLLAYVLFWVLTRYMNQSSKWVAPVAIVGLFLVPILANRIFRVPDEPSR
jgi:hypothetical protein